MKLFKRILAGVMTLCMVVTLMPGLAFAEDSNPAAVGTTETKTVSTGADLKTEIENVTKGAITLQLESDITIDNQITISADKNITIKLNGKKISVTSEWGFDVTNGFLDIQDGDIESTQKGIKCEGTGAVTLDKVDLSVVDRGLQCEGGTIKFTNGTLNATTRGVFVKNGTVTLDTVETFKVDHWGVCSFTGGTAKLNNVNMTATSYNALQCEGGTIEFTGGTITAGYQGVFSLGGTVTIDGTTIKTNNSTYTSDGKEYNASAVRAESGTVDLKKVTVNSEGRGVENLGDSVVTINKGTKITAKKDGIFTYGWSDGFAPKLNIYGEIYTADDQAVGTNGTDYTQPEINIYEGAVIKSTSGTGMYIPNVGTLTIYGGTITGEASAIGFKNGKLVIKDGTLTATGANTAPVNGYSNGINASGATLQIEMNKDYKNSSTETGTTTVTISGGKFISEKGYALYEYEAYNPDSANSVTIDITGGTFKAGTKLDDGATLNSWMMVANNIQNTGNKRLSISGGTFSSNVSSNYLATGYSSCKIDSNYVVAKEVSVDNSAVTSASENTTIKVEASESTTAKLPVASVKSVAGSEKNLGMTVETKQATVTFNSTAMDKIAETLGENSGSIVLNVGEVEKDDTKLTEDQKAKLDAREDITTVISAELLHFDENGGDGKSIGSSFGGGTATVEMPYTLGTGKTCTVYNVNNNGNFTRVTSSYDSQNKKLRMTLEHFSIYVVVESPIYSGGGGGFSAPSGSDDADIDEIEQPKVEEAPKDTVTKSEIAKGTLSLNKKIGTSWKKDAVVLSWGKVSKADGYDVYAGKTGSKVSLVKSVKGKDTTSLTVKKVGSKSVSKKNVYKLVVKAYRTIDGEKVYTGKSYTVYTAGSGNTKYTDPKSITVSKKSVSLSAGKTAKISAKVNKVSGKKKLFSTENVPTLRYFSSDTSVAKVSASGKIKAVAKGSCTIYVVGTNGVKKSVKVTVK